MKLKFKNQLFQIDATNAVCDVFTGQPFALSQYKIDSGITSGQLILNTDGFKNSPISHKLSQDSILANIQDIQERHNLPKSSTLEGYYNLTIEMETGVGKTYTYLNTIFELNKRYGWLKFIIVVPSIAIREGVLSSLQITKEHFKDKFNDKDYSLIYDFFIYNSEKLTMLEQFATSSNIQIMIINSQAFNSTKKDQRRIDMKLDSFKGRKPIDVIAATNPILIIDEPQSVEGEKLKKC